MELYRRTNESKYFYKAFEYSEKNKAGILLEALASSEAKEFAGIPDNVLDKEKEILSQLTYFKNKIIEKPNDKDLRLKFFSSR